MELVPGDRVPHLPSLSSAPESSLLLLSVTVTDQDINPALEAFQVILLEGAGGNGRGVWSLGLISTELSRSGSDVYGHSS